MKLLLSKSYIDEKTWYNTYISPEIPENLSPENLIFFGNLKEMKDLFGVSNIIKPTTSAFSYLVSNDGSHITKLFEKKSKIAAAIRRYDALSFPIMYRDYRKEDVYTFSNDSLGSFESAWEKIGSPDTFAVYVALKVS